MPPRTPRLLIAIAHPDDETLGVAGIMARAAAEGSGVTIVCATRGEVGEIADPALATPETLGAVRAEELRRACGVLGVADVRFLDYRDSGMEGTPENADPRALCNAPAARVVADIATIIRDVQPEIVLTWDPSGGYGHPDHLAVHRHATAAFEQEATRAGGPRALYYMTLPIHLFQRLEAELRAQGIQFGSEEIRERARELPRLDVTTEIDVAAFMEPKVRSGAEHRTQLPADSPFEKVSGELRQLLVGIEYFHRAAPPRGEGEPTERAFWTGD